MNHKAWSFLFGAVMAACAALFVAAPLVGWWLPLRTSAHAWSIDFLFYLILWITAFFFVLTEALLVYFMFRYAAGEPGAARSPSMFLGVFKPLYSIFNTATKVELAWTVVPAVILLYLAFAQVTTWAEVKYKKQLDVIWGENETKTVQIPIQVGVSARQFEWRMRYPSPATYRDWPKDTKRAKNWANTPNFDDIKLPNELHVVKDKHVVVYLTTLDVLHSFNSPHMRIKQDSLPGKQIPVWFKPVLSNVKKQTGKDGKPFWADGGGLDEETGKPKDKSLVWEIACAELCGWGHYRMIGKIFVHDDEADFLDWLQHEYEKQNYFGAAPTAVKK